MVGSEEMTIAYVVDVKPSMSAEYRAFRTCSVEKCAEVFEHESLNCLMMFDTCATRGATGSAVRRGGGARCGSAPCAALLDTFSKRCTSACGRRT